MKEELYKQIFALVFGGVIGVIFKYIYDYRIVVLKQLWGKRYQSYRKLLRLTGILPLYPVDPDVTYDALFKRSEELRDWYFEEGGLLLSKRARDRYFAVQEKIQALMDEPTREAHRKVTPEDYNTTRKLFSSLRTEMTQDLMSRARLQGLLDWNNREPLKR